ncbi:SDR family NAD(P)-dependent oxidoreductase [Rhodococcus sp. T2V]|uniref:SDR family NAD(P)-dependent oxidoreductase n=1 Tax=Rhodococcus sp. T2V TaxID=3034164 RepID=UPI0023E1DABC|nr:SDR family NAD(P)-dependent oxidoreductase [Rhodococcus sp. T2V]MDF3313160.1 SDR family NAD(P)-dependent oxidoreductase [Rhodococcus sp. T2V]
MTAQPQPVDPTRRAVVTGAARGIGLAVTKKLASIGYDVAMWDVDADELNTAAIELRAVVSGRIEWCPVDITNPASVDEATDRTLETLGSPGVLVNNAGILGWRGPTAELPIKEWQRTFDVNVTGTLHCTQALLPGMRERGWGRIVNIASIAGKEGNPEAASYAASKAAVISLTKSLGKELATEGVLVNCVTPGPADTAIFGERGTESREEHVGRLLARVPMGRFVEVDEVAELVAWLSSPACSFSTATTFDISGGRAMY